MKTFSLLCLLLLVAAAPAYAGMPAGHGHGMMSFDKLDADKDGKLSRDEFNTMMQGSAHPDNKDAAFKMIDKDGDGSISGPEWEAFAESHAKAMGKHNQGTPYQDQESCNKTQ
ncbi:EF-hand domain-containing protein [Megalodesulfovibrio paquesii]